MKKSIFAQLITLNINPWDVLWGKFSKLSFVLYFCYKSASPELGREAA